MNFLNYFLSAIIISSAGFAGAYIAKSTKEEMPTAIKYFPLIQTTILLIISAVLINTLSVSIALKAAVYAPIALAFLKTPRKVALIFLAVALYLAPDKNAFFTISALSLLFVLTEGSFMAAEKIVLKKIAGDGLSTSKDNL